MCLADQKYPRTWREMSFDSKLFLALFACLVGLFAAGNRLTVNAELSIAALAAAGVISVSSRRRRRLDWRWPGTNRRGVLRAVGAAAVMFFATHPTFPIFQPDFLPWYLAGTEIAVFNILESLRVVQAPEVDFLKLCGTTSPARDEEPQAACVMEAVWRRATRAIFFITSYAVMFEFLVFFYLSGVYFRDGSPRPTLTQTEQLSTGGSVVYITPVQKHLLDQLETWASICIPSIIGATVFLHFIVGVKLLPNTPTLREIRNRKTNSDQVHGTS